MRLAAQTTSWTTGGASAGAAARPSTTRRADAGHEGPVGGDVLGGRGPAGDRGGGRRARPRATGAGAGAVPPVGSSAATAGLAVPAARSARAQHVATGAVTRTGTAFDARAAGTSPARSSPGRRRRTMPPAHLPRPPSRPAARGRRRVRRRRSVPSPADGAPPRPPRDAARRRCARGVRAQRPRAPATRPARPRSASTRAAIPPRRPRSARRCSSRRTRPGSRGADPVADAAGASLAAFPSQSTGSRPGVVALADAGDWRAVVLASVLAAPPVRAALLLSEGSSVPEVTKVALARLAPPGAAAVGGAQLLRVGASAARPSGLRTTDLGGRDAAALARAVDAFQSAAAGRPSTDVLVVADDRPALAMPAAAWAAKSGDSVLFTARDRLPADTRRGHRRAPGPADLRARRPPRRRGAGADAAAAPRHGEAGRHGRPGDAARSRSRA